MSYTLLTSETVYPASVSYQLITLTENITLSWSSSGMPGPIAAGFNDVNPDQAGWIITLPDATLGSVGTDIIFNNISAFIFSLYTNDGILLKVINPTEIIDFKLTNNATQGGVWLEIPFGGGVASIASFTIKSSDNSINVTNGVITPPGGVVDLKLPTSITNLNNLANTGIAVVKTTAPLTWKTATLIGGTNITITDGNGINNNPNISLNANVAGLNSLQVGSFTTTGNTMAATAINTDLKFTTSGTGKLDLNGVTISAIGLTVAGDLTVAGIFDNPYTPKAWCSFTDSVFGDSNSITIQDHSNIASISGGDGYYEIFFDIDMLNINYGVSISLGSEGTTLPPSVYNGFYTTRNKGSVIIAVVDSGGELVSSLPSGATVVIMSSTI